MARFKVVHSLSWEKGFCSVSFESDIEEEALLQAMLLSRERKDAYEVIDSYDRANRFPQDVS